MVLTLKRFIFCKFHETELYIRFMKFNVLKGENSNQMVSDDILRRGKAVEWF